MIVTQFESSESTCYPYPYWKLLCGQRRTDGPGTRDVVSPVDARVKQGMRSSVYLPSVTGTWSSFQSNFLLKYVICQLLSLVFGIDTRFRHAGYYRYLSELQKPWTAWSLHDQGEGLGTEERRMGLVFPRMFWHSPSLPENTNNSYNCGLVEPLLILGVNQRTWHTWWINPPLFLSPPGNGLNHLLLGPQTAVFMATPKWYEQ